MRHILNAFASPSGPLWARKGVPPIAGKFSTFLLCRGKTRKHETQQNSILQTNDSYIYVTCQCLLSCVSKAKIEAPVR
jgi:hypothetical protein